MMGLYPEENTQITILPTLSEDIWKKFEYFDKNTEEFNDQYDDIKGKLLDLWWEQFQKEYKERSFQTPIFKIGEVKERNKK